MPYIKVRKQSDGSTRYTAIVRLRSGKAIVHQEARTFAHRSAAASWAKHREVQLENQAVPGRRQHEPVTLAALIRWYIETFEAISRSAVSSKFPTKNAATGLTYQLKFVLTLYRMLTCSSLAPGISRSVYFVSRTSK